MKTLKEILSKIKLFLSFLLKKETLIKIILIQIIFVLAPAMIDDNGIRIYHMGHIQQDGRIELGNQYRESLKIKIENQGK